MIALGVTRHQAEDARRLLAAMVASSDEAIYGTSRDGTVVSWNAGAERLFGYAGPEIVGRGVTLLYPPDREGELPGLMDRINRGEHVRHLETVRLRRDGSPVSVSLTLSPIHDAAGLVIGTSAIARDMTERHRAEERLRLLARALESTNEMVSVTDTNDRFTFVNAAFLRAYGYRLEDVIGQTPALLQSSQTPVAVLAEIERESRRDGWSGEL
jgi:PAS domain S-box-containing protein